MSRTAMKGLSLVVGALLSMWCGIAMATPSFPAAIAETLSAKEPACAACHVSGKVGLGTVNTPFGSAMRARGLVAYDVNSLEVALRTMESEKVDSGGDGIPDVEALRAGGDPNGGPSASGSEVPVYGCVGQVARTSPSGFLLWLFLLSLAKRRMSSGRASPWRLGVACAGLLSCHQGSHLAQDRPHAASTVMRPLRASTMEGELRALSLDPQHLPRLEDLTPTQLHGVMGTFSRALGLACTHCHDPDNPAKSTRDKVLAKGMWNTFVRPQSMQGGFLYCDSCHQGAGRYLSRGDPKGIERYMWSEFSGKLSQKKGGDVACANCHGDPFDAKFLSRW